MNPIIYRAFSDELEKIAKAGVVTQVARRFLPAKAAVTEAAPKVYSSGDELLGLMRSADDVALTGERGIHSLGKQQGSLQRSMESAEAAAKANIAAEEQMAARVEAALRAGKLDPKVHSVGEFMRTGQVVPKKPVAKAPEWRPEGTGVVQAPGPAVNVRVPPAPAGPAPGMPSMPGPPPGAYSMPGAPPPSTGTVLQRPPPVPPAPTAGASTWRPTGRQLGTGAALLGTGGLAGYSMS